MCKEARIHVVVLSSICQGPEIHLLSVLNHTARLSAPGQLTAALPDSDV